MSHFMAPRGMIPPIPTFLRGGKLEQGSQRTLVESLQRAGADGVLTLGTAGEGPALSEDIREEAISVAVEAVRGFPIVVGCGGQTTDQVGRQIEVAATLGAAAALVLPPFYYRLSQNVLTRYLTDVADRAAIPILLYHIPQMTGNPFAIETVRQLSIHPNVAGIKDSQGDFARFLQMQRDLDSDEFAVFQGVAALVGPSIIAGSRNSICTVTALLPQIELDLRNAITDADLDAVRGLMHNVAAVAELFRMGTYPFPANFKAVAALLGIGPSNLHDPAVEPDPEHVAALAQQLARLGIPSGSVLR